MELSWLEVLEQWLSIEADVSRVSVFTQEHSESEPLCVKSYPAAMLKPKQTTKKEILRIAKRETKVTFEFQISQKNSGLSDEGKLKKKSLT